MGGRPVTLLARGGALTLVVDRFGTLFTLRQNWPNVPPGAFFKAAKVRLLLRLKWFGDLEVWPNPGFLVRRFLPSSWHPRRGP